MVKPGTFLDRLGRNNNKYVFISYSHKDEKYVFDLLQGLFDSGVNYWYDKELTDGEIWNEEVADIIKSEDCVGAVFLFSENSVVSNAVCREVREANIRLKEEKDGFAVLPVLVGLSSFQDMLCKIASSAAHKNIGDFAEIMSSEDRTAVIAEDGTSVDRIRAYCERIGASEKNYVEIRDTKFSVIDGKRNHFYELGTYPVSATGKNAPIRWKLICRDKNNLVFVSEYCLDFVEYGNATNIGMSRFGLEGKDEIVSLNLIDEETLKKYADTAGQAVPTDYADFKRTQSFRAFWVKDSRGKLLLYNNKNELIKDYVNAENDTLTAGIRLVMVLDDNKIKL